MIIDPGQVYTFKLNSGEELIARVREITETEFTLEEPVSVAPGAKGMGLVPSLFTSAGTPVTLRASAVSLMAETEASVRDKYIEATTGIQVPSKKILVG